MTKIGLKLLVVSALCVLPVLATTITFDEGALANGTSMTSQWVSYGITFSVTNGTLQIGNTTLWGPAPGGSDIAGRLAVVQTTSGTANASVVFHAPGDAGIPGYVSGGTISFSLWDTNATPNPRVTVNAYDLSDVLIGTYNLGPEYVNGAGGLSGNVHKLVFVDNGGDGHIFDNLNFGPITAVPEPGTFALLGIGLLGLGMALRRRRA